MNMHPTPRTRGSALVTVMIFLVVLCILVGSIVAYSVSERRLNARLQLHQEAKLAAEALAEYGAAQVRQKFSTRSTVTLGASGTDALVLPPSTFWTGSNVQTGSLELKGGTVTALGSGLVFIDPADPVNASDELRNQRVARSEVPILAKATVVPKGGGRAVTAYVVQRVSVRSAPLFKDAVFYNMDMEVFPGPNMMILGPVTVNGSVFASGQGNPNNLDFRDVVRISGNIYHAWKSNVGTAQGTSNEALNATSPVRFLTSDGSTLKSMYNNDNYNHDNNGGSTLWRDSMMGTLAYAGNLSVTDSTIKSPNFGPYASAAWGGMLLTSSHGVMASMLPGIGSYTKSTSNVSDNSNNSSRQLIEPSSWPSSPSDPGYNQQMEVEKSKFSNNAGVYIKVNVNPTTLAATITAEARSKNSTTPTKTWSTLPSGLVTYEKYVYNSSTSQVTSGMYDRRRNAGINLVEIDIAKLKTAVTEMATPTNAANAIRGVDYGTSTAATLSPSDWTGIVYVEVVGGPKTNLDGTTTAATNSGSTYTSVRLVNGSSIPSYGSANPGLTIATNAPLYVLGNYNADGTIVNSVDPLASSACQAETGENPAALVSDAITILSPGFSDANSKVNRTPTASATVEISAAMLMGLTPTNKAGNGKSSGGLHNFPRFLENWSGKAVWIRGSLVALFESRVATEPWNTSYYSPPARNWGFNSLFRQGIVPPGTPMPRKFRRTQFTDLTETQYNTLKSSYGW